MDTDEHGLKQAENDVTRDVIGSAFEVITSLGHGLHEKPYENALVVELSLRRVLVSSSGDFPFFIKTCRSLNSFRTCWWVAR